MSGKIVFIIFKEITQIVQVFIGCIMKLSLQVSEVSKLFLKQ